jgi:hypothetical protein
MTKQTIIVVHPAGDYHTELELEQAEFTEFKSWGELTTEERADVIASQAAYDYMLCDERFVHESGVPDGWAEYVGTDDFSFGELEPIGLGKLSSRAVNGDENYTDNMNPVFRRTFEACDEDEDMGTLEGTPDADL